MSDDYLDDDELINSSLHVGAFERYSRGPRMLSVHKCCVSFDVCGDWFDCQPFYPFKPRGLAIYGAPEMSMIEIKIRNEIQANVSFTQLPTKFFNRDLSFEQISKLIDEGKEPIDWCDFTVVNPSDKIIAEIFDKDKKRITKDIQIVMWGVCVISH